MKRRATESNILKKRQKAFAVHTTDNIALEQPGRFRKMHPFDCGIPHCRICHYSKYPKRELHEHELLADVKFKEQLKEIE